MPITSKIRATFIACGTAALCTLAMLISAAQAQQGDSGFKYLEVKLVDSEGNAPSDAGVEVTMDGISFPMMASDEGIVSLNVPSSGGNGLQLKVDCEGFASTVVSWSRDQTIPTEYTIKMQKAVEIGGIVHDEQGQPVEGATVVASNPLDRMTRGVLAATISGELGSTDSEGRWNYAKAPDKKINVFLKVSHPDYLDDNMRHPVTYDQLRAKDHVLVLKKGIELRGTVTDSLGMPVEGAKIALGSNLGSKDHEQFTDDKGNYVFGNLLPGSVVMTVYSPDYAPELKVLPTVSGMEPVDIQLDRGKPMRIRVTDPDGQPIAGVGVVADTWRGQRTLYQLGMPSRTDSEGLCVWKHAPTDEMQYDFWHGDHMSLRNQKLTAGREVHEIELPWPLELTGTVVDADTDAPIEKFEIVQGMRYNGRNNRIHWERYNIKQGRQGKFNVKYTEPRPEHLVRIEAVGYRPVVSRGIKSDEGLVELEFKLEKGTGPSGVVTLPDGSPAAGVEVVMASGNSPTSIQNGSAVHSEGVKVVTDEDGQYQLPYPDGEYLVVFLHEQGWRQLSGEQLDQSTDVQLQEWARVQGVAKAGAEPVANEQVSLNFAATRYDPDRPQVYWNYYANTDAHGNFAIEKVKSGSATVARMVSIGGNANGVGRISTNSHTTPVDLKSGETAQVQIGGTGRRVKGKFTVDKELESVVSWSMAQVQFYEQPPQMNSAGGFFYQWGKAVAEGSGWAPSTTIAAQQQPDFRRSYATGVNEQGEFELFDVHPGTYNFGVTIYEKPVGNNFNWNSIGRFNKRVVIPKSQTEEDKGTPGDNENDEPIELGEYNVEIVVNNPSNNAAFIQVAPPQTNAVFEIEVKEEPVELETATDEAIAE